MHRKVFYAIHNDRMRLDKPADIAAFMTKNGIDAAKFMEVYGSFGVQAKLRQANQLVDGYRIDGVPAMGIQGRFYTSGALAGDNGLMLVVTDYLLQRLRNKLN
jgi:thiol:disulfide interchange protein DsbA